MCTYCIEWSSMDLFGAIYNYTIFECLLKAEENAKEGCCCWCSSWVSLRTGFSLGMVVRWGDRGGETKSAEASRTSRRTFSCCSDTFCARNAVKYRPAARKTVINAKTPAAENKPSLITRQLGLGLDQFFKWPDSILSPISNRISATAKQILKKLTKQTQF